MNDASGSPQLARRLTTGDAVVIGLGSMIGAGVFAAIGPAAQAAGAGLLIGLALAAAVAYANATSSAQLAALYPESGGTYVYGRERLGGFWGYLAGWGFVVGKTASCAAMALTFGAYAAPEFAGPLAVAAVVLVTGVNAAGVRKTAGLTRAIVIVVLAALAAVVVAATFGGEMDVGNLDDLTVGARSGSCSQQVCCSSPSPGTPVSRRSARRSSNHAGRSRGPSRSRSGSPWPCTPPWH